MEQEDIELLQKEFSGRLHYGLIVSPMDCGKARLIGCLLDSVLLQDIRTGKDYDKSWDIEYVKPYLRPMSSMTEEEKKEYASFVFEQPFLQKDKIVGLGSVSMCIDWLNQHHLDYRGLIKKGLAIAVTKDNNPYKV